VTNLNFSLKILSAHYVLFKLLGLIWVKYLSEIHFVKNQYFKIKLLFFRDIKLENILCSTSNVNTCIFKLADFGFAKLSEADRPMNSPCCTPAYVCPEVF